MKTGVFCLKLVVRKLLPNEDLGMCVCIYIYINICAINTGSNYPGKRPQTVCVRSVSRKSRDIDALGSREVMVVMK